VAGQPLHGERRLTKEQPVGALLLVLLIIIALFIVGFAVVKFLIWVGIILAIIWLIGFFVRGVEGARWYRW
jgi:accessory gene regulator protein AgrB